MAITKTIQHNAKIYGDYTIICNEKVVIKDNSVIVSSKQLDGKSYYPDSDWSSEDEHVKTLCNAHFTAAVKTAWGKLDESEQDAFKS